ncbi:MAG TPA: SAM-dependent chlorinase/fluorinase [Kofleriaceae bacterium]|jgi:S-adenosylmethionine hydrolase|nr:SAM-dependent chlorinase/fluorinase [Kofleriaceae bacterium]
MALVTLTTDFGTRDGYVGAIKGVILTLAPDARLVDITHEIPRHDVAAAAFALAQAVPHFPDGTIHVAVVDPGVGGGRAAVIVDAGAHLFIGPDNGLFSLVAPAPQRVHAITSAGFRRDPVSSTFNGRDLFAVAAGRLAAGATIDEAGPAVALTGVLALPRHGPAPSGRWATVVHVDAFGNLITDAGPEDLPAAPRFRIAGMLIERLSTTFESVARGDLVAYIGSGNTVEIAVREGNASTLLRAGRGAIVIIEE